MMRYVGMYYFDESDLTVSMMVEAYDLEEAKKKSKLEVERKLEKKVTEPTLKYIGLVEEVTSVYSRRELGAFLVADDLIERSVEENKYKVLKSATLKIVMNEGTVRILQTNDFNNPNYLCSCGVAVATDLGFNLVVDGLTKEEVKEITEPIFK